MKLPFKIVLFCISGVLAIALVLSAGTSSSSSSPIEVLGFFGLVSIIAGPLLLLTGLIVFLAGNKEWGQGLLLSGGIILLLGALTCGSMLSGIH